MKQAKTAIVLLLLGALGLCLEAGNASALQVEECKSGKEANSTATEYTDAQCTKAGEGKIFKTPIVGKKQVTPTSTETAFTGTTGETSGIHAALHVVIAGVSFQITCTGATSKNTFVENIIGGYKGSGRAEFSGCSVTSPTVCTVPATLTTVELSETTKEMSVVIKPAVGETFLVLPISGASCPAAFKGEKSITGEAVGGVEENGASTNFNSASGNKLKFGGVEGAQITAKTHSTTPDGTQLYAVTP